MAERTCCHTDVTVFGHTSCELGQPVRPAWVIQPSSAPPAGHAPTPIGSLGAHTAPACVSGAGDVSVYVLPAPGDVSVYVLPAPGDVSDEHYPCACHTPGHYQPKEPWWLPRRRRLPGRNTR